MYPLEDNLIRKFLHTLFQTWNTCFSVIHSHIYLIMMHDVTLHNQHDIQSVRPHRNKAFSLITKGQLR